MKHTVGDLYQMQSLPLKYKIQMTKRRIQDWYDAYDGMVYCSFSGGKDSTVLVDIIEDMRLDIPFVFCDTGLEYPEIREFVKTYGDKVTWLKPKMNYKQVIEKYGYPIISKEVTENVQVAKEYLEKLKQEYGFSDDILSNEEEQKQLATILAERMLNRSGGANQRLAIMLGWLTRDTSNPIVYGVEGNEKSAYALEKWKFLLNSEFKLSNKCCAVMKKEPSARYTKETGRKPITAQMASESRLRKIKWLKNGCNAYDTKDPMSNPMSFWTEQDVLEYIKEKNLPICSVYGDIVEDTDEVEGQLSFDDICGISKPNLKTTGCKRTGCVFCLYGIHLEKSPNRLEQLKITHPAIYDYVMRDESEGGLGYRWKIDWLNKNGGLNIKY